ncbi:Amino_oxidase domain-containing protein [Psidium guajava]|nr:Amino_oxidase domain-containing protein [Psidium guajava]
MQFCKEKMELGFFCNSENGHIKVEDSTMMLTANITVANDGGNEDEGRHFCTAPTCAKKSCQTKNLHVTTQRMSLVSEYLACSVTVSVLDHSNFEKQGSSLISLQWDVARSVEGRVGLFHHVQDAADA